MCSTLVSILHVKQMGSVGNSGHSITNFTLKELSWSDSKVGLMTKPMFVLKSVDGYCDRFEINCWQKSCNSSFARNFFDLTRNELEINSFSSSIVFFFL